MDFVDANIATSVLSPIWNLVVETWLKPSLKHLKQQQKLDSFLDEEKFASAFGDYLQRSYKKHSFITTVVFQNQQKALFDLYIPLTLIDEEETRFAIDNYPEDLFSKYSNILISDSAGMGKSTLLKVLFLKCMETNAGIPVLIELRQIKPDFTILDNIRSQLSSLEEEVDNAFLLRLIQRGDFVFFFDGFDEISNSHEDSVVQDINNFINKAHKNQFVLTSRPEKALTSFNEFKNFGIQPLAKQEAFELLTKYGKDGEIARALIEKLKNPEYERINEFLTNPLLVSLLYRSYEYKATIPLKKHVFYRQVFDSLYEEHDITKDAGFKRDKYSRLDIDDFHKVLRIVGFATSKAGEVEYDKDKLLHLINQARKGLPGLEFNVDSFLKDLLSTVPLFVKDGNYYRWTHKSIQDYFAAQYICFDTKENQALILEAMSVDFKSSFKYSNVIDLCYDMDYKTFRKSVLYRIAKDYIEYYDTSFNAPVFKQINNDELRCRKELLYNRKLCLVSGELYKYHFAEGDQAKHILFFEVLEKKIPLFNEIGSSITTSYKITDIALARTANKLENLLHILSTKRDKLVFSIKRGEIENNDTDVNLKVDSFMTLCDSPESIINSPIHFKEVNQLLLMLGTDREIFLNIDECRELVEDVELISKRETSSFYLNGL